MNVQTPIERDINKNINQLKEIFKGTDDIIYRNMECGQESKIKMAIVYVDGMTNKTDVSEFAIENLMNNMNLKELEKNAQK